MLEKWLLSVEAEALRIWFAEVLGLSQELWQQWGDYMEAEPQVNQLPDVLLLSDPGEAVAFYRQSFQDLGREPLRSFLIEQGQKWSQGLARHPVLC